MSSRDYYRCLLGSCGLVLRSDHLRNHYIKYVRFKNIQLGTVNSITDKDARQHTSYFAQQGYVNKDKIPDRKCHVRVKANKDSSNKRKADSDAGDRLLSMFASQKKSKPNTEVTLDSDQSDDSTAETSDEDEEDRAPSPPSAPDLENSENRDPSQTSDELDTSQLESPKHQPQNDGSEEHSH